MASNRLAVLHISQMWPLPSNPISGLFVYQLLINQRNFGDFRYEAFVPKKLLRRDVSFSDNLRDILHSGILHRELAAHGWYVPALGLRMARGLNARMAGLFLNNLVRKRVREHEINLVHAHTAIVDGYLACELKRTLGIPYVMHVHGGEATNLPNEDAFYRRFFLRVYRESDLVICNSSRTKRVIERLVPEVSTRTRIVPFGIKMDDNLQRQKRETDKVRIVTVARLVKSKRIGVLLEALHSLADKHRLEVVIIGDGPERPALEARSKDLGISSATHFLGFLPNEKVREILPESDLFVLPAVDEGFGVVYLEALAAGLPVIGVKGEGCSDIAEKGKCMFLVERDNPQDLAEKIELLLESAKLRRSMSKEARRVVRTYYSWQKIVRSYEKIYMDTVSK